jgi:hypothetical protein
MKKTDTESRKTQTVTFRDFVNCDTGVLTTAILSVEEICDVASTGKERSDEDMEQQQPFPTFGEAVADFETVQLYLTAFEIDNASMQQITQRATVHMSDIPHKADFPPRLLQEVAHVHMYAYDLLNVT